MGELIDATELAPGVHRLLTIEDNKYHGYHILIGPNGPIVIDPGYINAPTEVYESFLQRLGWCLEDVHLAVITHSDADHHGGCHELREQSPGIVFAAHEADADLIESHDRIFSERYRQFEDKHGIVYDQEVFDWLTGMMGPEEEVDVRLQGGEELRIDNRTVKLLHTPGHSRGHLMIYDSEHDVVIGGDGFFGRGLTDVDGNFLQPPPYFLYPEYGNTIELVESLDPDLLSFTHYELLEGEEITKFIQESKNFIAEIKTLLTKLLDDYSQITVQEAIEEIIDRQGSYGLDLDLAFPITAHYEHRVDLGELEVGRKAGHRAYRRPD